MGSKNSSISLTALGEPGKLIINEFLATPDTARENMALEEYWALNVRIAWSTPGVGFSIIFLVTSGVISRGVHPVPPDVRIKQVSDAIILLRAAVNFSASSGTISVCSIEYFDSSRNDRNAGMHLSSRSPAEARSETIIMPTENLILFERDRITD